MSGPSSYDIPSIIDDDSRTYIFRRLSEEQFDMVGSLTDETKPIFREIIADVFNGNITFDEATIRVNNEVRPPRQYRASRRWQERLVRTETSKIFTLGYGDYLISIGEEYCYVPPNTYDVDMECALVIEGKTFSIREIQENIYRNYGRRKGMSWYPTVPLHPNCRHIIIKIPEESKRDRDR